MEIVLVLVVLAVVVIVVAAPLWSDRGASGVASENGSRERAERAELEAAKEAKLREIREAELDYRTGKLTRGDWRELDAGLRAEAIELLRRLDALANGSAPSGEDTEDD
jgi:hypothetical protein